MIKFSKKEKKIGRQIVEKFLKEKRKNQKLPLLSFEKLYKIFNKKEEKALLKKILKIDPKKYGIKVPFYGIFSIPKDIILIKNQTYKKGRAIKKVDTQYLSKKVYLAFKKMNKTMKKEIGRSLNIISGYRSPAYQLLLFIYFLEKNKWNIKKTLKKVALPGWSEHGYPKRQGMDFAPKTYCKMEEFCRRKEYKWLLKNASRFGFYLSFPEDNKTGITFEPWHWHYIRRELDKDNVE